MSERLADLVVFGFSATPSTYGSLCWLSRQLELMARLDGGKAGQYHSHSTSCSIAALSLP